jgi:hypothetical protein
MNRLEAEWLGARMSSLAPSELFPLLNVGSSTHSFRTAVQPWIDEQIFAPLRAVGGQVVHLDIKDDDGVDVVGDLLDPDLLPRLAPLKIRSILVSNLFEHVTDREAIAAALLRLVPAGGFIIVSGPQSYPFHADPIDTLFRPSLAEMHAYFPGTEILSSAVIDSGNWRDWDAGERGRSLSRTLLRLLLPFYRPAQWWIVARQAPYLIRHITAFALVLRKLPSADADRAA